MRQGETTFARLVHFFLLTEKEYSDDLHIKCVRGGEVRELLIVNIELRWGVAGSIPDELRKKLLYSTAAFV